MEILAGIMVLATLVEGTITYLFGEGEGRKWLRYVSLVLGVSASLAYKIDILGAYFGLQAVSPIVGYIVSGVIIGRGANYANDLIGKLKASI